MKKNYIIYSLVGATIFLAPNMSYSWRFGINSRTTEENPQNKRNYSDEEKREISKEGAGQILENIFQIPGARKTIEWIDRKNQESGFYEQQKENKQTGPEKVRRFNPFKR